MWHQPKPLGQEQKDPDLRSSEAADRSRGLDGSLSSWVRSPHKAGPHQLEILFDYLFLLEYSLFVSEMFKLTSHQYLLDVYYIPW